MEGLEDDLSCGDFFSHLMKMEEEEDNNGLGKVFLEEMTRLDPCPDSNSKPPLRVHSHFHTEPTVLNLNCPMQDWELHSRHNNNNDNNNNNNNSLLSNLHLDWISLQHTPLLTPLTPITFQHQNRMEMMEVSSSKISSTLLSNASLKEIEDQGSVLLRNALESGKKKVNEEIYEGSYGHFSNIISSHHPTNLSPSYSLPHLKKGTGYMDSNPSTNLTNSDSRKVRSLHHCHICTKPFKDKYSLTVHIRTHTGEKPFPCSLCAKNFRQKAHLAKHYQTHSAKALCQRPSKEYPQKNITHD